MEIGIVVEPMLSGGYRDLVTAATRCEAAGLVSFARTDHLAFPDIQPVPDATDAFTTLGGLAAETSKIRLATMVTPITFRHPAIIAKSAATLDQMSGCRFDLGMGTGWLEAEHRFLGIPFPPLAERYEMLEDGLGYVSAALGGNETGWTAGRYRLGAGRVGPAAPGVSLIVGGRGPRRTPRLAGLFADEFNHMLGVPLEQVAAGFARARRVAEEVGRDPDAIRPSIMSPLLVAGSRSELDDRIEVEALIRGTTAPAIVEKYRAAGTPMGTVSEVRDELHRIAGITGARRYHIQFFPLAHHDILDRMLSLLL